MNSSAELKAAAANCRRLSKAMGNPDDERKLLELAKEFDELIEALEAAGPSADADEGQRNE
jgi:hypothetical protein